MAHLGQEEMLSLDDAVDDVIEGSCRRSRCRSSGALSPPGPRRSPQLAVRRGWILRQRGQRADQQQKERKRTHLKNTHKNPSGSNLRHLKNNVHNDRGIGRLAILHRWLEVNLFGGLDGVIVEAVTQSVDHAHDTEFAGGLQNHFQEDLALNPQIPSFLSIDGSWLGKDFRRQHFGRGFCGARVHGGRGGHIGAGEAAGLNRACGSRRASGVAVPLPKPVLTTTPGTPLAPPVPLP